MLASRSCSSGRYAGAACATDADCTFCGAPCRGATCDGAPFAAAATSTYTVLAAGGPDTTVEGCGIMVRQREPYNRCVGGAHDGKPCLQTCSAPDGAPLPKEAVRITCDTDAQCTAALGVRSTCLQRDDCAAAGGSCSGPPGMPAGPGSIRVVDFSAVRGTVRSVRVVDHHRGDFTVSAGPGSEIVALDNTASERPLIANGPAGERGATVGAVVRGGTVTDSTIMGAEIAVHAKGGPLQEGGRVERTTVPAWSRPATGILVERQGVRVTNNQIWGCTRTCIDMRAGSSWVSDNDVRPDEGGTGIAIGGGMSNLVDGNVVTAAGSRIAGTLGIRLTGLQPRVVHNLVAQLEQGIRVEDGGFNVTVANNRLLSLDDRSMAALTLAGAGAQLLGNYVNWKTSGPKRCGTTCDGRGRPCSEDAECGPCTNPRYACLADPLLWLGAPGVAGTGSMAHAAVIGNLFHGQPGVTAIRVVHSAGVCAAGSTRLGRCITATGCPAGAWCFLPGYFEDTVIASNTFVNSGPMLDLGEIDDASTQVRSLLVTGNLHQNAAHPPSRSIVFPSHAPAASNVQVQGNLLARPTPLVGWDWRMGIVGDNGQPGPDDDTVELAYLTNHTGAAGRRFAAVGIDSQHDASFTYARRPAPGAIGILLDEPADGAIGKVAVRGTTTCEVAEIEVRPGDRLAPSDSPGRLSSTSARRSACAVALGTKPAGAPGTVRCLVQPTAP